jgi:hypothetical protein
MSEIRATALIRELLLRTLMLKKIAQEKQNCSYWACGVFQTLKEVVANEFVAVRRQLMSNRIFLVDQTWRKTDVLVKYKEKDQLKQVAYTMPMLEAEAVGRLEHILDQ